MPRAPIREKKEFEQILVDLARVTRVVKGGRRFRFRASLVIGNRKGKVGFGLAKGRDVSQAMEKAYHQAKKNIITVPVTCETIPHEARSKFGSAMVILKPASRGTGIIAGGAVRAVMDLAGIKNIVSKMYGSANKINNVKATIAALRQLRTKNEALKMRGKIKVVKDKNKKHKSKKVEKTKEKKKKNYEVENFFEKIFHGIIT